jgi:hypothetical protein
MIAVGCTPMTWSKAGFSSAEFKADDAECRELAWRESFRAPFFGDPFWPRYRYGYPRHGGSSMMWRMQEEQRYYDFCMRARGYRLVPAN